MMDDIKAQKGLIVEIGRRIWRLGHNQRRIGGLWLAD